MPEVFTVFMLPKPHRQKLRTTNWLENGNGTFKKRTSVVAVIPTDESVLPLGSAVLMETAERWLTGR